jgi:hypothetical protein
MEEEELAEIKEGLAVSSMVYTSVNGGVELLKLASSSGGLPESLG